MTHQGDGTGGLMRLVLMRHGATAGNAAHAYVGRRTDEPLSEEGRAQCARAGSLGGLRAVYVSPLARARQTASACFPAARQVVVDGLAEFDFGAFEGRSARQMEHDEAYRAWVASGCEDRCPGGEDLEGFVARTCAALRDVLGAARRQDERLVVVVAHGGTVMAALHALGGDGPGPGAGPGQATSHFYDWHVGNCEGYVAEVQACGDDLRLASPRRFSRLWEVRDTP